MSRCESQMSQTAVKILSEVERFDGDCRAAAAVLGLHVAAVEYLVAKARLVEAAK